MDDKHHNSARTNESNSSPYYPNSSNPLYDHQPQQQIANFPNESIFKPQSHSSMNVPQMTAPNYLRQQPSTSIQASLSSVQNQQYPQAVPVQNINQTWPPHQPQVSVPSNGVFPNESIFRPQSHSSMNVPQMTAPNYLRQQPSTSFQASLSSVQNQQYPQAVPVQNLNQTCPPTQPQVSVPSNGDFASDLNPKVTLSSPAPQRTLQNARHHLMFFFHAQQCLTEKQGVACTIPDCSIFTNLYNHLLICKQDKDCPVIDCVYAKTLITHWSTCPEPNACPICNNLVTF